MHTPETRDQVLSVSFTGQGGEYFRIWIVNLALTIVTLGIYSAWAKVRRLQYFHRNTHVAGAAFDYHGEPLAILKGRLIAVALLVLYYLGSSISPAASVSLLILLMAAIPWLVQRSLCFRLHNTSYRGLRFRFDGSLGSAYKAFLLWPLLGYLSIGLLAPLAHQRIKTYQVGNSRYGRTGFAFGAGPGRFYALYGKLILMVLVPLVLVAVLGGWGLVSAFQTPHMDQQQKMQLIGTLLLLALGFYLALFLFIGPWYAARIQNLSWNATTLGPHRFTSDVRARDLLAIYLTNFVAIVLTLGLYKPYADIRVARYRLQHMALLAGDDLDRFVAEQSGNVGAMGEESAELFDFDIGF